jgi:hypothetical protein
MNIRLTKLFWRCCGDAARWLPSLEKPRLELPEPAARERLDRESGQQGEVRRSDAERTRRLRAAVRCALCQRVKTRRDCRDHLNTMTTSKSLKEIAQSRAEWAGGVSPPASHRTVLEALTSHGSCYPTPFSATRQWTNIWGRAFFILRSHCSLCRFRRHSVWYLRLAHFSRLLSI